MLESQALIDKTLSLCGETLEFENGEILGIPGHLIYNIPSFDSPYDIEKQDFSFRVCHRDFFELEIQKEDTFTYTLNGMSYNFSVTTYADDLTGWFDINANLEEITT